VTPTQCEVALRLIRHPRWIYARPRQGGGHTPGARLEGVQWFSGDDTGGEWVPDLWAESTGDALQTLGLATGAGCLHATHMPGGMWRTVWYPRGGGAARYTEGATRAEAWARALPMLWSERPLLYVSRAALP